MIYMETVWYNTAVVVLIVVGVPATIFVVVRVHVDSERYATVISRVVQSLVSSTYTYYVTSEINMTLVKDLTLSD